MTKNNDNAERDPVIWADYAARRMSDWVEMIRVRLRISVESALDEIIKFLGYKYWMEMSNRQPLIDKLLALGADGIDRSVRNFLDSEFAAMLNLSGAEFRLTVPLVNQMIHALSDVYFPAIQPAARGVLLDRFIELNSRSLPSRFRTPRSVVDLMLGCLQPSVEESVFDPDFGFGDLLVEAFRRTGSLRRIGGFEENFLASRICALRLAFECLMDSVVDLQIGIGPETVCSWREGFDVALCVPALGCRVAWNRPVPDCPKSIANLSEIYAIENSLEALRPGGRMATIVPDALLQSGAFREFQFRCEKRAELLFSYAFDSAQTSFSIPGDSLSALFLRKRGGASSHIPECAVAVGTPIPEAVSAFTEFRESRHLW